MIDDTELSPAARARQREMLPILLRAARARRRRRRITRSAAAAIPMLTVGALIWAQRSPAPTGSIPVVSTRDGTIDAAGQDARAVNIVRVADDSTLLDLWRVHAVPVMPARIDDDELLEALARDGHRDGLVMVGGRTMLASTIPPPTPGRS